jgi:hypothetical protein
MSSLSRNAIRLGVATVAPSTPAGVTTPAQAGHCNPRLSAADVGRPACPPVDDALREDFL